MAESSLSEALNKSVPAPKPMAGWQVLLVAALFFGLVLLAYFCKFHGMPSNKQEVWGQFGDFVGGVVNPLIGLCTIWLLIGSLKQSHTALLQAHADLDATRRILDETQKTQEATEKSLKRQIEIAEQAKEMNNAIALAQYYGACINDAHQRYAQVREQTSSGEVKLAARAQRDEQVNSFRPKVESLQHLLDREHQRLIKDVLVADDLA
jgi:hypothetical protein